MIGQDGHVQKEEIAPMLSKEENELLTRVGPGTPAGEMLRRYWWPVGFSENVKAKGSPTRVRLLGEDLVLFRDGNGRLGVLGLHCSHRGTSLEFGRVEDAGIRCCYHGWLYDVGGKCLEQPAEPEDGTFKNRVQHPAYQAQEIGGFIFAYLGPEPAPLLPKYDLFLREDGERQVGAGHDYCNWLQRAENSVDQTHLVALHAPEYPHMALKRPVIGWERTPLRRKDLHACAGRDQAEAFALGISIAHAAYHGAPRPHTRPCDSLPRSHGRYEHDDFLAEILSS